MLSGRSALPAMKRRAAPYRERVDDPTARTTKSLRSKSADVREQTSLTTRSEVRSTSEATCHMRTVFATVCCLVVATGSVFAQSTGGGGGGALSPGAGPTAPGRPPHATVPTAVPPATTAPTVPANPDPQRNNMGPSSSTPPLPGRAQPGATATRPGTATSSSTDGYVECMNLWSEQNTRMSKQDWSATCESTRLPPR
jgi:hypothetical protein